MKQNLLHYATTIPITSQAQPQKPQTSNLKSFKKIENATANGPNPQTPPCRATATPKQRKNVSESNPQCLHPVKKTYQAKNLTILGMFVFHHVEKTRKGRGLGLHNRLEMEPHKKPFDVLGIQHQTSQFPKQKIVESKEQ